MVTGSTPAERVTAVVRPVVRSAGLHLEGVTVAPAGRRSVVRVVVDLEDAIGGVDADTLGDVSRRVSAALDADDPIRGAYVLEVSTPGTDRPLTELRHFRRARTRLVRLSLTDGGTVRGRLVAAEDTGLELDTDDGTRLVPLADVARGTVEVELSRDDEAAGREEDA